MATSLALKTRAVPAKQARAQCTMERVERTARRMLNRMSWDDISMADLAEKSRTSIGSIYARFPSKAALLDYLDEIYCREVEVLNTDRCTSGDATSFEGLLSAFVEAFTAYHHANRGLIRTLILETRTKGHAKFHSRSKRMNLGLEHACNLLLELAQKEGRNLDASQIEWALFLILAAMRELTLFPQGLPRPNADTDKGAAEIVTMAMRYLEGGAQ